MRLVPVGATLLTLAVAASEALAAPAASVRLVTRDAERFTTRVTLTIPDGDVPGPRLDAAFGTVLAELDRLDALLSEWRPDSPVSALNAHAGKGPVPVPAEVVRLLSLALDFARVSGGAFDPTFKTYAGLWRLKDPAFEPPSKAAVEALRPAAGYRHLVVEAAKGTAELTDARTRIGLGGIAKGYALERGVAVLRGAGLSSFCLRIGGELYCAGDKRGVPWVVGVRDPLGDDPGALAATLAVRDAAFTTSGDYERFVDRGGRRYHHLVDVRTGWPAEGVRSATVLARSPTEADALSTSVFVMGVERGLAMIEGMPGAEALVIDAAGVLHPSSGLKAPGQLEIVRRAPPAP